MRRISLLIISFVVLIHLPFRAFADDRDYLQYPIDQCEVLYEAYHIDGSHYQVVQDPAGDLWLYVDDLRQFDSGLVFVNGYYYFVTASGRLGTGALSVPGNSVIPSGTYSFDSLGRMSDPPQFPASWQSEWTVVLPDSGSLNESVPDTPMLDAGYPVTDYLSFFLGDLLPASVNFLDSLLIINSVSLFDLSVVIVILVVVVGSILMRV